MLEPKDIKKAACLLKTNNHHFAIHHLNGDASDRNFYRLSCSDGSLILMKLQQPYLDGELPFVNIWNYLYTCQLPVPQLYSYDQARGIIFLEDLGDMTMEKMLKHHPQQQLWLYQQAIDLLLLMQAETGKRLNDNCIAYSLAFDIEKFMFEFNIFVQYFLNRYQAKPISSHKLSKLQSCFLKIATILAQQPRVFTHRDYHSRNLMVHQAKLKMVDFQDARLGLCQYDLASLLRDSYVVLKEELIDKLVEYYLAKKEELSGDRIEREEFRKIFDYTCLQRNIKVCGTFTYLHYEKAKSIYLSFLPQTWAYVLRNLSKYKELAPLEEILAPVVVPS